MTRNDPSRITMKRGRASDRVLQDLRRMILTHELPPGAVVTEASLVDVLKCSRTPLREALQRLSHEHLVVAVPGRGVSIADLSIVEFGVIVEAEVSVESPLARLAAERITDGRIDELSGVLLRSQAAVESGDVPEVVECDFHFHTTWGAASGNHLLLEFQTMLLRLLARYVYLGFQHPGNPEGAISDHQQFLEALRLRDPDAAEAAIRTHISNGRERMRRAL
jgi:GntR family transcriptional regulator, rspAB operon transcriptional repressor